MMPDSENLRPIDDKQIIREAHQDIDEFNETRKTISDLVNYKRALLDPEHSDFDKFNEIKDKAIDAINHLFDEDTGTPTK